MERQEMATLVKELALDKNIKLEEIPEIDLYMDQVIQLFENKYSEAKRNDDDKVLTKTMINNYAKGKLLMPIQNKKYSKEHLILMSFIYNLKGSLSISDIKDSLNHIVKKYEKGEDYPLRQIYEDFLQQSKTDLDLFEKEVLNKTASIEEKVKEDEDKEFEDKFLLLCSMINMSNMYRRMGEKIVDEFFIKDDKEK
ncbi:MAG: DUF1836 domain-containing protein [Terrisporobacter sp.]|uniref:DUF1836 domain-containing protein n=1 Tax=Clostridia TaxID=186801 RepID=UPI002FC982D7